MPLLAACVQHAQGVCLEAMHRAGHDARGVHTQVEEFGSSMPVMVVEVRPCGPASQCCQGMLRRAALHTFCKLPSEVRLLRRPRLRQGNHERDQPHTGDRFQNTATDSGACAAAHPT